MPLYPFNPNMEQEVQGDGTAIRQDMGFITHLQIPGNIVADTGGVHADVTLLAAAQTIYAVALTQPAFPRIVSITGTKAGGTLTGNVVVNGTDGNDIVIADTIALNDNATVNGTKGFKTITDIVFPVRVTALDVVKVGFKAFDTATVAAADSVHAAVTLLTTTQNITTVITQPTCPRVVSITGTKAGGSLTGNVVITGLDAGGAVVTDTIAINTNDSTVSGVVAFAVITNIALPVRATSGDTVKIGVTEKLGLGHKLAHNTVLAAYHNNALEATPATAVVSATNMSLNTVDLNTSLNNAVVDVYLIV